MHQNARRFRLGLFVLGSGALFLCLLGFVLQGSLQSARATYFILFKQNVKGMVVGSRVNFQGVPIGMVSDLRFQDGSTLVELSVDPTRAAIQDQTRARMDRLLVTGQVTVELEGYGPTGKPLPPGSFVEPKEDPLHSLTATLPEVVDRAASALLRLDGALARVEQLLGDPNQARIGAILQHLEQAATGLNRDTLPAANALLADAAATNRALAALPGELQGALQRLEPELQLLLREASGLAGGLRGPAQTALQSLRTTLDDLRGLARQLKLAPDSLLFGVSRPAAPPGGDR